MKKADNTDGLVVSSDSDWAGMYTPTGEVRSRTGSFITYNGMPIAWKSSYQQCKGTNYTEDEDLIATSSAEAETYAAHDTVKLGLHITHVGDEVNIAIPKPMKVGVDAAAAIGSINNTGTVSRMKHLDLREAWVQQLRDKEVVDYYKVVGTDNPADFFTKIHHGAGFKTFQDIMMGHLDEE